MTANYAMNIGPEALLEGLAAPRALTFFCACHRADCKSALGAIQVDARRGCDASRSPELTRVSLDPQTAGEQVLLSLWPSKTKIT